MAISPERTAEPGPLKIAVTVDDLPVHGPLPPGQTWLGIHQALLDAFAAHGVPAVYGFANLHHLDEHPELADVLHAWVKAGHPLGNHTLSHPHMKDVGLRAYLADIDKNQDALAKFQPRGPSRFRYPYLLEGFSRPSAEAVRRHLAERNIQVAEVTIDFYDWAFNPPYVRCLEQGNHQAIDLMKTAYLRHARQMLDWADSAAQSIFGRRIPHVLLLHAGGFDAVMMNQLLTFYEDRGAQWITLDEALADPAYAPAPFHEGRIQGTMLELHIEARNLQHPPWPAHPEELLSAICLPPPE